MSTQPDITPAQIKAALATLAALAEAIRDLKEVRSGTLYAHVSGHMSLKSYEAAIDRLVGAGLVRRDPGHLLVWVG